MKKELKPHVVFPPGEIIRDEIGARGWSQSKFAQIIGRPYQVVNGILNGKRELTPETALQIGAALGTSAEMWMRMEAEYRLHLAEKKAKGLAQISGRARKAS